MIVDANGSIHGQSGKFAGAVHAANRLDLISPEPRVPVEWERLEVFRFALTPGGEHQEMSLAEAVEAAGWDRADVTQLDGAPTYNDHYYFTPRWKIAHKPGMTENDIIAAFHAASMDAAHAAGLTDDNQIRGQLGDPTTWPKETDHVVTWVDLERHGVMHTYDPYDSVQDDDGYV